MKKTLSIVAAVCVVMCLSACGRSGPQELILGKWVAGQPGMQLKAEFAGDGTAKLTMLGQTLQGTYKLEGDDLVWTVNGITSKMKVKVTATELEVTGNGQTNGQTVVYKRE